VFEYYPEIIAVLLGQFLVLLGAAGFFHRVVRDHDKQLANLAVRLRSLELQFARRGEYLGLGEE
jgi:hypothetical protein